jgi:hypothetical protein
MSKPLIHAKSSARKFGGHWTDYIEIHELMDSSKVITSLPTHRALTHNSYFVGYILTRVFGEVFKRKSDGKLISTRDIGEQHIAEDFNGFIPSASDYLDCMNVPDWMMNGKGAPPSHALILKQRKTKESVEQTQTRIHID